MSKLCGAIIIALIISISFVSYSIAKSKKITCEVKSIENNIVKLDCGDNAEKIKKWKKVNIRKVVRRKALQGC